MLGDATNYIEQQLNLFLTDREQALDEALFGGKDALAKQMVSWVESFPSIADYIYPPLFERLHLPYSDYHLEQKIGYGDTEIEHQRANFSKLKNKDRKTFYSYYYNKIIQKKLVAMMGPESQSKDPNYKNIMDEWKGFLSRPGYQIQSSKVRRIVIYLALALELSCEDVSIILTKCLLLSELNPKDQEEIIWYYCLTHREHWGSPSGVYQQMLRYLEYYDSETFDQESIGLDDRKKQYSEYRKRFVSDVSKWGTTGLIWKMRDIKTEPDLFRYLWKVKFLEYDQALHKKNEKKDFEKLPVWAALKLVRDKRSEITLRRRSPCTAYRESFSRFPRKLSGPEDAISYSEVFQLVLKDVYQRCQHKKNTQGENLPTDSSKKRALWETYENRTYCTWEEVLEMVYAFEKVFGLNRQRPSDQGHLTNELYKTKPLSKDLSDSSEQTKSKSISSGSDARTLKEIQEDDVERFKELYKEQHGVEPGSMPEMQRDSINDDLMILMLFLRKNRKHAYWNNPYPLLPLPILQEIFRDVPDYTVGRVKDCFRGYKTIRRNELLTTFFIDFWENYSENYPKEMYPDDSPQARIDRFVDDVELVLSDCGMRPFYQRPPYEIFLVLAMKFDDPLAYFYASWETVLRATPKSSD